MQEEEEEIARSALGGFRWGRGGLRDNQQRQVLGSVIVNCRDRRQGALRPRYRPTNVTAQSADVNSVEGDKIKGSYSGSTSFWVRGKLRKAVACKRGGRRRGSGTAVATLRQACSAWSRIGLQPRGPLGALGEPLGELRTKLKGSPGVWPEPNGFLSMDAGRAARASLLSFCPARANRRTRHNHAVGLGQRL